MTLDQGDPRLLETDIAKRLLTSTIPARCAYTALDGTPRVVGSWFAWTGEELVPPTFIAASHVSHATCRGRALRANPDVAGTRMARIAVRPAWVGLLDFETRMPSALGGTR